MKKIAYYFVLALLAAFTALGCTDDVVQVPIDTQPPATPRGVTSITGDGFVEVLWFESDEPDLAGYRVYRGRTVDGVYNYQATVREGYYFDDLVVNGLTYYYAVSSFDYDGNESDLSPEDVFDTPRPAGSDLTLYDPEYRPDLAGYDFSAYQRVSFDSPAADIIVDYEPEFGVVFIDVGNVNIDIQDFGYTESLDDISWAPDDGWSKVGYVEAIPGHTYIVWTADNHYAKFRVVSTGTTSILIDWAYQAVPGNPELRPPAHGEGFLRPSARTNTIELMGHF